MSFVLSNLTTLWGFRRLGDPIAEKNVTPATLMGGKRNEQDINSMAPNCTFCCCSVLNQTLVIVFMAGLAFAIVIGNVITLTVFLQTRQFRTPQGYLKVSLALADMMVGVLVVPFSVYTEITLMVTSSPPLWYQRGEDSQAGGFSGPWQPCKLIGPMFAGCTFVSINTIFLMTIERCVAILKPLHKDTMVTRRRTLLFIAFSWAGSFLIALAPMTLSDAFTVEYNKCSRMCNYAPVAGGRGPPPTNGNIMLLFPVFDFTLLGGTLVVNILSFTSIRRYSQKRKQLAEGGVRGDSVAQRPSFSDIKAAKTIGILTFAFTASFSPIAAFVVGNVIGYQWCNFSFFAFWILTSNSCCNVIIYSVRDQRFRKGVTRLFRKSTVPAKGEKN
ncbi:trace amine-associated receptor 7f-like [Polypterus senegalus]|uniref:trace amine-associated receptor 7f-like n=1 Tax=Polypterus senegalus TaxID=55291 RepID=UPI001963A6DB|nr:trace amine-associated receptor 7f-like [Polypterus senegalus]